MNNQVFITLKRKLDDLAARWKVDAQTQRNALKEELQYYVLNFICHHPDYNNWIMYGGSALRICHGLNRMSIDLDFEIQEQCTDDFLSGLKKEMEQYFTTTYALSPDALTIKIDRRRGLLLKFLLDDELTMGQPSKQAHVKIDLNHFVAAKTVVERIPINRDQLSFVITIYNMSALMASKIAAIFLRGKRGVGKVVYEEKGRDIYDLLWYMGKKIIPDLDYLAAKGIAIADLQTLFARLTVQINKVSDANLKQDLSPLFVDKTYIQNWLKNWRESYLRLAGLYNIRKVSALREVLVRLALDTDNYSFTYVYETEEGGDARITYAVSDYWLKFKEGDLPASIDKNGAVIQLVSPDIREKLNDKLKQYVALFYGKTEDYLKKTNRVVLGEHITTKTIRMTADKLNQKEQIVLNRSALLSCELEDLLP